VKTIAEVIRVQAARQPEQLGIWHEGSETSYAELDRRSSRVANALIAAGVRQGDRVCFLDKGHAEAMEAILGIAKAGAVFTPVNYRLAPSEMAYVISDAAAPLLLVGHECADAIRSIEAELTQLRSVVRWGEGPNSWQSYEGWRDAQLDEDPHLDRGEDEAVWQLYTSGTTGRPKGAELTNRNMLNIASAGQKGFGDIRSGDVGLACMPLYHIGGAGYAMVVLYSGASLVVTRDFIPAQVLELIEKRRVTHSFFVPAMLNFMLQQPGCDRTDFSSLRAILYGASPIPEDLLQRSLEVFGCSFIQAYGLTETTGAVALLSGEDHERQGERLRSCGRPVGGNELRVVDGDGRALAVGEVGEITVRGPSVMKGYWNRPEATSESIREGWFHTGDAGYFDTDGYLYIHDRVKDMIVSGGENIYPAEVESVLFSHPAVADVAVIGVPDERFGEAVKAIVVFEPDVEATAEEIMSFCKGKIAGYKRPRSVEFTDALPRNPTGKVLKRELREKYWEGHARRVN
jgi:acyl-CoA synthetase (AMP-forming)/AMP-acid ligase II